MDVEIGQLLDKKYRIVRLLGQGGMGAVYEGTNVRIHHRVAIKVLHPGIAADAAAVERFEREAQAAGKIGSDHIVEVYDLGELPNGARYMVMEFLDGENLSAKIERAGRLPPEIAAPLMLQMLEGLGAAHAAGIVHRDLKPDNIFLQRTKSDPSYVKIVDFGVSKFNSMGGGSGSMTRTGSVVGTPYYMSPEQLKGSKYTDHRSDLYSAGVVLFEAVTGKVPFQADTFNELMFKIVFEEPPDPQTVAPGLDPTFAQIVRRAMTRDPAARYQSAAEFAQAIIGWMNGLGQSAAASVFAGMPAPRPPMPTDPGAASMGLPPGAHPMGNTPNPAYMSNTPNPAYMGNTPNPAYMAAPHPMMAVGQPPGGSPRSTPSGGSTLDASGGAIPVPGSLTRSAPSGVNLVASNATARRAPVPALWLAAGGLVVLLVAGGSAVMLQHKHSSTSADGPTTSAAANSATAAAVHTNEPSAALAPPTSAPSPAVTLATPPPTPAASDAPDPDEGKAASAAHDGHAPAHAHAPGGHHAPAPSASAAPAASAAPPSDTATLKGRTVHTQL